MLAGSSAPSGHSDSAFTGMPALGSLPTNFTDVTKSRKCMPVWQALLACLQVAALPAVTVAVRL